MIKHAVISDDGKYRYSLSRFWEEDPLSVDVWVMLNPSTADAEKDDPTIRRCIGFSKAEQGVGGILVVNLYAYRSTTPENIPSDPVEAAGLHNNRHIENAIRDPRTARVIAAWGAHRRALDFPMFNIWRTARLAGQKVYALGFCANGEPRHPLYVAKATVPVEYDPWKEIW